MTFGVVLPFINILRLSIPCKWSNTHPVAFMIAINTQIDWTLTNMSPNKNVYKCELFWASNLISFI
jgi:hypothetical protein